MNEPQFPTVFRFYAAFSKLQTKEIRSFIVDIMNQKKPRQLVNLLHCLYEAQEASVCLLVASSLNRTLGLRGTTLSPLDGLCVGYFLLCVCIHTEGEFRAILRHCQVDDYKLSLMVKELTGKTARGCIAVDLVGNSIGENSLSKLPSNSRTLLSKLDLWNNKDPENERRPLQIPTTAGIQSPMKVKVNLLDTYSKYLCHIYGMEPPHFLYVHRLPRPPILFEDSGVITGLNQGKTLEKLQQSLKGSHYRKVVLIKGVHGVGKSTLAWHMCQKWKARELFQEYRIVIFASYETPKFSQHSL